MMNSHHSTNAKQHWLNHIKQWQDSGLSQANYFKKHDLKPHNLSYHKRKQECNQSNTPLTPTSTGFLHVEVSSIRVAPETLTLHFAEGVQLTGLTTSNLALVKQLAEVLR